MFRKSESEKVEMSQERERLKADAELRARQKAHYKMQPRDTKKMMKKSKRKAKRLNRSKITL